MNFIASFLQLVGLAWCLIAIVELLYAADTASIIHGLGFAVQLLVGMLCVVMGVLLAKLDKRG